MLCISGGVLACSSSGIVDKAKGKALIEKTSAKNEVAEKRRLCYLRACNRLEAWRCCGVSVLDTRPGGVLPYMAYTGMCRWAGYGFWPLCPKQGI